mgnify:CR=1 FL=1
MFDLTDDVAIFTGGAGVLPRAMAAALLRAGARVALWGRGTNHPVDEAAGALAADTGAEAGRVAGISVDTGDEDAVARALAETSDALGDPGILVNGVGGNRGKAPFTEVDVPTFADVVQMNLIAGLVIPTKIVARAWIAQGIPGCIINLASMASYRPLSGVSAYGAAKAAVMNLTEANAAEFAPHGIRVNAIAPGFFVGHQNRALLIANDQTGELTPRGQSIMDRTPMGRFGEPSDLEGALLFLASRKASGFVTGTTIPVDGGYRINSI